MPFKLSLTVFDDILHSLFDVRIIYSRYNVALAMSAGTWLRIFSACCADARQDGAPGPLAEARQSALPPLSQAAGFAASGGVSYSGGLASRSFAAAAPVPAAAAAALSETPLTARGSGGADAFTGHPGPPAAGAGEKASSGSRGGGAMLSGVPRTAEAAPHDWQHSFVDSRS